MKLIEVKNKFKKNHKSDGFSNNCYDNIIEEIYNLTLNLNNTTEVQNGKMQKV